MSSARGAAKRRSVIDAAIRLFLEQGYDAASMDAVAAAAGASKRTLYNYFPTKRDLFRAAVAQLYAAVNADIDDPADEARSPAEVLTRFAYALLAHLRRPETRGLVRLMIAATPSHPELSEDIMRDGKGVILGALERRFRRWAAQGVLRIEDPALAAAQFVGALKECCFWPAMLGLPTAEEQTAAAAAVAWTLRAAAAQT